MKVYALHYYTNHYVGRIEGEEARDVNLVAVFSTKEEAIDYMHHNTDYGDDSPEWHWWLQEFELDVDPMTKVGTQPDWHYTRDVKPCDFEGVPDEEECIFPDRQSECKSCKAGECNPDSKHIAIEDIEAAFEAEANAKVAGIANRLAEKVEELSEILTSFSEDIRDEFPDF